MSSTSQPTQQRSGPDAARTVPEWVTMFVSIAIVIAALSLVTWLYVRGSEEPPKISAEVLLDEVREHGGSFYLPVKIVNQGDLTVANAIIEGELVTGRAAPETAEVTVDYLAGGERVSGTLIFGSDPREGDLSVRPTSYQDP